MLETMGSSQLLTGSQSKILGSRMIQGIAQSYSSRNLRSFKTTLGKTKSLYGGGGSNRSPQEILNRL